VVIASNITGNSQMSIMMALEESRNHSISRLCRHDAGVGYRKRHFVDENAVCCASIPDGMDGWRAVGTGTIEAGSKRMNRN